MKKIKIMLLSIALFAIVGGALAFKAKFDKSYCTTDAAIINGVLTCPITITECPDLVATTVLTAGDTPVTLCYTETTPGIPCNQRTDCTILTTVTDDAH